MKVVVNKCYGGFGLSDEAEDLYAKKSGFDIFRYTQTKYKHSDGENLFERLKEGDVTFINYSFKKDRGESFAEFGDVEDFGYWYSPDIKRDDKILVEVIEELGDKASSRFSKLEIVNIPDDVEWEISEYDGYESVDEVHRSW